MWCEDRFFFEGMKGLGDEDMREMVVKKC